MSSDSSHSEQSPARKVLWFLAGDVSEAGQEVLVYGVRKFRQLRKIFSTLDYWS